MSDKCVVCNGVGEGKPLYKKLGSSDCSTDVFTALHEMQLISLPLNEKDNHYICWDCDESVAEEYSTFIKTETKRKADEVKRKKQDEARNIKLQKKLKLAFKKVHEENLRASGITPPVSKYKMKEKEREENKYHSSHCILCKCSFEDNQGRSYQRFTLMKMVNDEHDVAQVLQKLDVHLNIDLSDEIKRKRFVCCLCYNKMRRDYKSKNKNELEKESKKTIQNSCVNTINDESQDIFKRRPTAEEHAAEIAKLIPPSLAKLYKVVTQDEKDSNNLLKDGHCDNVSFNDTKKRKLKQAINSSVNSNSSEDSTNDSSSSSSTSDSSEFEFDQSKKSSSFNNNNIPNHARNSSKKRNFGSASGREDLYENNEKNNINKGFRGISTIRNLKNTDSSGYYEGEATMEIIKNGVCNLCGLAYSFRPKSFWNTLNSPMPSVTGVTVSDALQILDSKVATVNANIRKKKFVCKPCYAKVCNGFRSQIIQRIAEKKGIAVDQLEASKLKVKGMDSPLCDLPVKKVNGTCENKFESSISDAAIKCNPEPYHKKKSKKKDKHHHSKKHRDQVKPKVHERTMDHDIKLHSRSDHRKAVFKFTKCRINHINSPKYVHDMSLLKLINKSRHLQYRGKVVILYNVRVNVAEIQELLPPSAFKNEPVRLELLKNVHLYSNLYRNLKNRTGWSICILCHKTKLMLKETSHWLEDPVAPPNLMVPLRWAKLSLVSSSSPPTKPNIAMEDGKVCSSCHQTLAIKFGKFVGAKVAVSHGLSSEKIVLDKYKVSFDSNAMNIIADPLERVVAVKEITKKHKIGPKSKKRAIDYYNSKHCKSPTNSSISDKQVIPVTECEITKVDNSKFKELSNSMDEFLESQDNVSLDLALSESSDSEDDPKIPKQVHETESNCGKMSCKEINYSLPILLQRDIPTKNVPISSSIGIQNNLCTDTVLCNTTKEENAEVGVDKLSTNIIDITTGKKNLAIEENSDVPTIQPISDMTCEENSNICNSESTVNALSSGNEIQSVESSQIGQSSGKAHSLEKLNESLQSHINYSDNTIEQESLQLSKENAETYHDSPTSSKMDENKVSNCNEDNDTEVCDNTMKQINLSKIMLSLNTSHTTEIKNLDRSPLIDYSEHASLELCSNKIEKQNNDIKENCRINLKKESVPIANQSIVSHELSDVSESCGNLINQIDNKIISDLKLTEKSNISEVELHNMREAGLRTNDDNITREKTLSDLKNKKDEAHSVNCEVLYNNSDLLNKNEFVDLHDDAATIFCNDDQKGKDDKLDSIANTQHKMGVKITNENSKLTEIGSAEYKVNANKDKLEIFENECIRSNSKQIERENIIEHHRNEADIVLEDSVKIQMDGETSLEQLEHNNSENESYSRTSFINNPNANKKNAVNKISETEVLYIEKETVNSKENEVSNITNFTDDECAESKSYSHHDKEITKIATETNKSTTLMSKCENILDLNLDKAWPLGNVNVDDQTSVKTLTILATKDIQKTEVEKGEQQNIKNNRITLSQLISPLIERECENSKTSDETKVINDKENMHPNESESEAFKYFKENKSCNEDATNRIGNGTKDNKSVNDTSEVVSHSSNEGNVIGDTDPHNCTSVYEKTVNNDYLSKEKVVPATYNKSIPEKNIECQEKVHNDILGSHLQQALLVHSNVDHEVENRAPNISREVNVDMPTVYQNISAIKEPIEVKSNIENLRNYEIDTKLNIRESKRKYEKDSSDFEILPKTKKVMIDSNYNENEPDNVKINDSLSKCNDVCDKKDIANDNKFKDNVTNLGYVIPTVNKESEVKENENILPFVKGTPARKPVKRGKASTRNRKRNSLTSSKTHNKCLSELIDKENATSVDVVTEYLNAQREKIKELIKPISSEEIHHNAKTCVDTLSENLIKIRSKLDRSINNLPNADAELPVLNTTDKQLQNESFQTLRDDADLGFLSLESEHHVDDIGENTVAPFAQRKKCRGRPPNTGSDPDSWSSASNTDKDVNTEEATSSCFLNIWQSIQGISLDDLLTKDIHQPLRLQQYNTGVILVLNDIRELIGAPLEDLVAWLTKLLPLELSEKGLKPCTEKISSYIISLNTSNDVLDPKKLNERLSEDFFVNDKSICYLYQEKANENVCFVEDIMDESYNSKEKEIHWDDYLAPVNLDNLLKGKESRVTWEQFNNGLLYALWRVNNLLYGDEENFIKWLSLTSTTPMKVSDYQAMAKAVIAIDKHLVAFPEEIDKLVAPIVVKSDKEIPSKKIQFKNKVDPVKISDIPIEVDDVILEKISVKSLAKKSNLNDNQNQNKTCDRLNESIDNNNRKRTINSSHSVQPSKKTARVLPQPSHETELEAEKVDQQVSIKVLKAEEINKRNVKIPSITDVHQQKDCAFLVKKGGIVKPVGCELQSLENNRSVSVNSINSKSTSSKMKTRNKNKVSSVTEKPGVNDDDPVIIIDYSTLEERVPVITKVTSGSTSSSDSLQSSLPPDVIKSGDKDVIISLQSPIMSNESLQTQIQRALINQAKIPVSNPSVFNSPNAMLSHVSNVDSQNISGVPMIPVMSASGFVTMVPLSMRIPNLVSSPLVGNSHPYNMRSTTNIATNLPFTLQSFSPLKESPKEKELESKVSVLERQLQEIQKQNSQLFELNKKLLKKTTNAEDPQVPKGVTKTPESPHVKSFLVPSLHVVEETRPKLPRGRPRKIPLKKHSFE